MTRTHALRCALVVGCLMWSGPGAAEPGRRWEINGIALEKDQVHRLADDMAERTVRSVVRNVAELGATEEQRETMHDIYRRVALDVFDAVVVEVAREDLGDEAKEERVREHVLAGQERSHALLSEVLDERQMQLYSAWEEQQVDAYKSRSWDRRRRRRRR